MRKRYSPDLGRGAEGPNIRQPRLGGLDSRRLPRICAQSSERRSNLTKLGQFSQAVQLTERDDFSKV
jgi:hypothetical protein